jgi:uncharacterized protein (DUF1778 family)
MGEKRGASASARARRTSRINMRLTPEDLELIRSGARAENQDLTTFVIGAALMRSRDVLGQHGEVTGNVGLAAFE